MKLHLKRPDYMVIGGGVLGAVLAGVLGHLLAAPPSIEVYTRFMTAFAILVSVYFIYRARQVWEGNLARYLEIIGLGLTALMVSWVPHIGWHLKGMPPWLGIAPGGWIAFYHILTAVTFFIVGYGFYLFWQEG